MTDFILFNSSFHSRRKDQLQITEPHMRIGVASIAAYLRHQGAKVMIADMQTADHSTEDMVDYLLARQPQFICFSAYTEEIEDAAALAKLIKQKNPAITTILGGYHFSALPHETLQDYSCFDIGIAGEGERPLADIYARLDPVFIPGAYCRNKDGNVSGNTDKRLPLDLDTVPPPAWDLYELDKYDHPLPVEPLRGCPFSCNFCFRTSGRRAIFKDPIQFVDELEYLIATYSTNRFRFVAGTFPLKKSHAEAICQEIINRRLKIDWDASTRVDTLDDELIPLLKAAGCRSLQLGIESGDIDLLSHSSKGITPEQAVHTARLCKKAGLPVGLNFIIGFPGETHASARSTLKLAVTLRRFAFRANFAILVPFPGTEIYALARQGLQGLSLASTNWSDFGKQSGLALQHENFTPAELHKLQSRFYFTYYAGAPFQALGLFSFKRAMIMLKRLFA